LSGSRRWLVDPYQYTPVQRGQPDITVARAVGLTKLGPGLVLVQFPARIVEVFGEEQQRAGLEMRADMLEGGHIRDVEVAVDVREAHRARVFEYESDLTLTQPRIGAP